MDKITLIAEVAAKSGLPKTTVGTLLRSLDDVITDALAAGDFVPLGQLGKLKAVQRAEKSGSHPKTGAPITIAARKAVRFVAGKALKDALKS